VRSGATAPNARTAMATSVKMLMLTHHAPAASGSYMRRLHQQELAVRRARLWHLAAERAIAWSRRWVWYISPHVIELGEDLCSILATRSAATLQLASTCRCLRGLLLPRLIEQRSKAVRALYISGGLA